jgi:hypothetical protein
MGNDVKLEQMKREMLDAIHTAEKLAYAYFCECPVGTVRERASGVYENLRNAPRV